MFSRFHKSTAYLLLAAWPTMIGLATGWHVHSHEVNCESEECQQELSHLEHTHHGHTHSHHGHSHHNHSHSHDTGPENNTSSNKTNDPCPTCPHDSEDCQSCQILALTGSVFAVTFVEPECELMVSEDSLVESLISALAPSCFYLRGPPAGIIV
ncbi:MAG: hypothetical protein P8M30_02275 [Planctomycetaceae bacterium]|jgi:hypothetical protein|nr:hypothetical protein [Planctomycetaceae bacterium]MDC0273591.1 hypothetical protein [Planctomycetaceae bacterium]MDG2388124.1 hypothetical protein [Planctomycetaceae bacterium]